MKIGKIVGLFIMLSLLVAVTSTSCKNNGSNTTSPAYTSEENVKERKTANAVYLYKFEDWKNEDRISELSKLGINDVFLSIYAKNLPGEVYYSSDYTQKLIDFIVKAYAKNIYVHLMSIQTYDSGKTENHADALERIKSVINFCKTIPETPCKGINIDIEPHALDEWKNANEFNDGVRENLMKQFVELLSKINSLIKGSDGLPSLQFSADIGWWWNEKFKDGLLPSGDINILARYLDFVAPMAYSTAVDILEQAGDEITAMPTMIAIQVDNFSSYNDVIKEIESLNSKFKDNDNYLGVVIFKFATLKEKADS